MKELIEEIILNSEESSLVFIADSEVIGDVALNLLEDGVPFVEAGYYEIEELMEENSILAIAKNIYEDGTVDYFIERIFNNEGETLEDDSDVIFIVSDLIDCIDMSKIHGIVISVEPTYEDSDDEDYEKDIDECDHDCENCKLHESEEDIEDVLTEELISSLIEVDDAEDFVDIVKSKLREAYYLGRTDAIDEIQEKLYNIE